MAIMTARMATAPPTTPPAMAAVFEDGAGAGLELLVWVGTISWVDRTVRVCTWPFGLVELRKRTRGEASATIPDPETKKGTYTTTVLTTTVEVDETNTLEECTTVVGLSVRVMVSP